MTNAASAHAAQTRREVLDGAYRLFTTQGYSKTTIGEIAKEADVSIQTIYSSVGNKSELIAQLVQEMDVTAGTREAWERINASDDAREQLRLGVQVVRTFPEKYGALLGALEAASGVEPELREHIDAGQKRHRGGMAGLVKHVAAQHGLREGLTVEKAAAIAAAVTNGSVWRNLHEAHGWGFDEIEDWMTGALVGLLLDSRNGL